jgi:hypothetical protein
VDVRNIRVQSTGFENSNDDDDDDDDDNFQFLQFRPRAV